MQYIHETTEIIPGRLTDFVAAFERSYQPLMSGLGARLVGLWETVPLSLPWTRAIALWEVDGMAHYGAIARAQHDDPELSPRFSAWREQLGALSTGGAGRILVPSPRSPTLAQLQAEGVNATVCVHEWITTPGDKAQDYAEQIDHLWVPWTVRHGRKWIGTYSVYWKNFEAISIWALEKGWDTLGERYGAGSHDFAGDIELKSWMSFAIALRERFDDGLLHALRPTPLRG